MFKGLKTHSVLYILHHYTPLSALDPLEVIEILKHRPRVPSLSIALTPPPQFSRGPTPLKPSEGSPISETPGVQRGHHGGQLKPEQERDIAVFRGFRALKLVLDAVWAAIQISSGVFPCSEVCAEKENGEGGRVVKEDEGEVREKVTRNGESRAKPKKTAARKLDFGKNDKEDDADTDNATRDNNKLPNSTPCSAHNSHEQLYGVEVQERLQEAKSCISLLYPLNYRLEILENIFSLLFLTSDDVRPPTQPETVRTASLTSAANGGRHGSTCSSNGQDGVRSTSLRRLSDADFSAALSSVALIRSSRHGFLIGERAAGDLLGVLQDSMHEMRAARFVLTQSATVDTLQPDAIQCSVDAASAQQRSAKLEQYINEARWRLQLVSTKHGVGVGQVGGVSAVEELSSSDGESGTEVSESDSEREGEPERETRRRLPRRSSSDSHQAPKPPSIHPTPEIEAAPLISDHPPSTILGAQSVQISPSSPLQSPTWGIPMPSPSHHLLSGSASLSPSLTSRVARQKSPRRLSPIATDNVNLNEADPLRHRRHRRRSKSPRPSLADSAPLQPHLTTKEDSGECADVDDNLPQHLSQRRKRLRSRTLQAVKKKRWRKPNERADTGCGQRGVVSRMLASPRSLLRMCLRHGNISRAHEVLRMFDMGGQFGVDFVQFSEHYESVCRKLEEQSRMSLTPKSSPSLTPQERKIQHQRSSSTASSASTSLSLHPDTHLHIAIAHATTSSSVLESLHHLLSPLSLPRMLLSGDDQLERLAMDSTTVQTLSQHVSSLVMLDIIVCVRAEGHVVRRIIEEASGHCQPVLESLSVAKPRSGQRRFASGKKVSVPHEVSLPGPFSLLQFLSEVSGYFTSPLSSAALSHTPTSPYHTPHTLFSTFLRPLRTTSVVGYKTFKDSYQNSRERFHSHFDGSITTVSGDVIKALSQSVLPLEESQRSLSRTLRKSTNLLDSMFGELADVLDSAGSRPPSPPATDSPKLRGMMRRSSSVLLTTGLASPEGDRANTKFLLQFSRYLTQFVELLMKCVSHSTSG